jgi:hypothetical protein
MINPSTQSPVRNLTCLRKYCQRIITIAFKCYVVVRQVVRTPPPTAQTEIAAAITIFAQEDNPYFQVR